MSIIAAYMVPHPPLIIPEVGKGGEEKILETTESYNEVGRQIAGLKPDTIIISSPHAVMYSDYFHISPGTKAFGSFANFGAREVRFNEEYDNELVKYIESVCGEKRFPAGTKGEKGIELDHGTMVPLYFIEKYYHDFKLVRLGLSGLDLMKHYELGKIIKDAVSKLGRRAVYIASGDLSHKLKEYGPYGFSPEGPVYDERIMDVCSRGCFSELFSFDESFCDKAAECGHRSFVIMAGALDGKSLGIKKLSHQDVTGVGYGICSFNVTGDDEGRHFLEKYRADRIRAVSEKAAASDAYVRLARETIELFVKEHKTGKIPAYIPDEMKEKRAGAFVSIHENGKLRGCIGTFLPTTDCIAEEIMQNAVSAAVKDPRFSPIEEAELPFLEINVDILSAPEDIDSEDMLDVKKYGVIVRNGARRGLLLPDLDGVDTVSRQIEIARYKAGISPDEEVSLQRFEVVRHY